jgi:hypothetical protein
VRPISNLSELYYGFADYRLEMMEERIRQKRKELHTRNRAGKKLDTLALKGFLGDSIAFLQHTNNEIVEESKVRVGHIDEMEIPNVQVCDAENSRAAKRSRIE